MKKAMTYAFLIVGLFCFNPGVKASEIIKENSYLKDVATYKVDEKKSTIELEFNKKDVDFYYVNICDKTNNSTGCKNEPNLYSEAFQKNEKKVTLAFRKEGIQGIEIAMKDKDGKYKGITSLILDISPRNFLEDSFVAPKDDKFIQDLLKTKFKGYEKWTAYTKVTKVHQYITTNYKYDYDLYEKIKQGKITFNNPDLEKMKNEKIGICYDLSALNAAILRAMGVPTKVVVGDAITSSKSKAYHSWNSVYVNKQWKLIDTTWDLGKKFSYKNQSNYKMHHEF